MQINPDLVPGIIVDSGSNTNGNYIKYEDGSLICYGQIYIGNTTTGGNSDGNLWYVDINIQSAYAHSFISRPMLFLWPYTTRNATPHFLWLCQRYDTAGTDTFGNYRIYSPTNTTMVIGITYFAIGKWK